MKHDNLIYILQKQFPDAVHGVDFWVAHPIDRETGKQSGEAFIADWKLLEPQPDDVQIKALWDQFGSEALVAEAAEDARRRRNVLIEQADILINRASDSNNSEYLQALIKYRQALRDVPQQEGFPTSINWPEMPENPTGD